MIGTEEETRFDGGAVFIEIWTEMNVTEGKFKNVTF